MPQNHENLILNPVEFAPELPQVDLSAGGLFIGQNGPDYGEASQVVERVKQAIGEGVVSRHWPSVDCSIPLWVGADREISKADAYQPLEAFVGELQRGKTLWIRRDFADVNGFSGSVGCPVDAGALSTPLGYQPNEIVLKLSRSPIWYATSEVLAGEVSGSEVRDLQLELAELLGTAPGLIRIVVKNEGAEDWRGCPVSIEYDDYSSADTAKPRYKAVELTCRGEAEPATPLPPEVRAVGTVASGTAAISPGLPAGTAAGDLLVMVVESTGETGADLVAPGWAEVPDGAEENGNTRLTLMYRLATGTDPTTLEDTGDHQLARIIGIKAGTFDPTSPFNVTAKGTQSTTKAVSIPGATTTRYNCLILACASGNLPASNSSTEFSAAANADLAGVTERIDNTTSAGDGGAIWAVTGVFENKKGAYGATTGTAVTAAERALVSVAVNGYSEYVRCPPLTSGWVTVLSSEIVGKGHMTHVDPRGMVFRLKDPSTETDAARVAAWEAGGGVASGVAKPEPKQAQWKLEWRALGAAQWVQTMEGSTPIVAVSPAVGDFQLVSMGVPRPERAITGDQRWEWRLQACVPPAGPQASLQPQVRDVYVESTEQWMRVTDTSDNAIDGESVMAPGKSEDNSGTGTVAWSSPSGTAEAALATGKVSHYLKATEFGFEIPTGATILGITVGFEHAGSPRNAIADNVVRLVKSGSVAGDDKATTTTWPGKEFPGTLSPISYGGPSDLWGTTWTAAQVNASNFGVAISAKNVAVSGEATAYVKAVTLTVAYSEGGNENRICFASRSIEFSDNGVRRQHVTDDVWPDLVPEGFLPYAPPCGQGEGRVARILIIPSVGDFETRADSAPISASAKAYIRPAYLFCREAAE